MSGYHKLQPITSFDNILIFFVVKFNLYRHYKGYLTNTASDISKIVLDITSRFGEWNFPNITSSVYAKYPVETMLLFV